MNQYTDTMKSEVTVRTQGIKGGDAKFEDKGSVTLYVTDRGQKRTDLVIDVDCFVGSGSTYNRRAKTLINIDFESKPLFKGTIEQLVAKLQKKTELTQRKRFTATGLVLGNLWGGGEGSYPMRKLNATTKEELLNSATDMLLDGSLDGGMGFDGLIGAILEVTTITILTVNDKTFENEDSEVMFLGDLTLEQQSFLETQYANL